MEHALTTVSELVSSALKRDAGEVERTMAAASTNVGVVQFFSNGNSVGVDQQSPFGVGLGLLPVGSYSLGTSIFLGLAFTV